MSGKDTSVIIPITLSSELLNLIDHMLVLELVGSSLHNVEIRVVLNIQALDERVVFDEESGAVVNNNEQ